MNDLTSTNATFQQRLRAFRKEHGLSLDRLADRIGTKAYTVRRWEIGTSRPDREAANALAAIGFGPISDEETNLSSRSRGSAALRSEGGGGPQATSAIAPALYGATYPAWVANGPQDQEAFYGKLVELQLSGIADGARLSLIDEFEQGKQTAQALLESPKPTAASWNSNYGSHGWHRYVGRFPPHVVRALLNHFGVGPQSLVCDPFSGSGTTAVECRLLGIPFVGVEIGALSHLMGEVKAKFPKDSKIISLLADSFEASFRAAEKIFLEKKGRSFNVADVLARKGNTVPSFANIEKWFTPEAFLGVSLTVEIAQSLNATERDLTLVALSAKMRSIGNVDVDVVRAEYSKVPREGVDVCKLVSRHLRKMASDVQKMAITHASTIGDAASIRLIEGSALSVDLPIASIDAVVTSPPYGVEALSYLRTHLLSYRSLASILRHDPYDVREQTVGSEYLEESVVPELLEVAGTSPTFREFFARPTETEDKKSRQRRAGMIKFFEDMHLMGIRLATWLKDDGRVAWVIGNKRLGDRVIPTDKIIEESFRANGLELYDVVRHKLKTNNSNSQVPWQERIIQEEAIMLFKRVPRR
ncbi:helix-turn-helix transcriptional regulator [Altererythrobacter sp. TH136]|uniref:helix-turn-helix domain-containing protein n=1 Tax=Altererythrobacter sp. TH136 TaxID=2067415 RepID=UPI0011625F30|nr:helix-turn-helix transcriptional regulator [Altererythrobacter sp. TH136]QDM40650.1 helix-turn-helix domain-containing protein [Altererythrobacter sp. TH136]